MPLDCEESVGHSCGCPFGLSSETGLLSTISFSGSDRMDNVLKDHRCPTLVRCGCPTLVRVLCGQGGALLSLLSLLFLLILFTGCTQKPEPAANPVANELERYQPVPYVKLKHPEWSKNASIYQD